MSDLPKGFLALPVSPNGAGVLVLHAWWGLNEFMRDLCRRLAQAGYAALAPDLYHGAVAQTIEQAEALSDRLPHKQAQADLTTALDQLLALPTVHGRPVGVIGFSLGAYFAMGLAAERPQDIRAVTVFYGARGGDYSASQASFLGHFAETDPYESASGVKKLERSLRKANRPVAFFTYPGTGHWFFESDRPEAYNAQAAELAWARTLAFLSLLKEA